MQRARCSGSRHLGNTEPVPLDDRPFETRPRTASDVPACAELARAVHAVDGYPVEVPGEDYVGFVAASDALGAWVAESEATIVGHVALHRATSPAVMRLARSKLDVPGSALGIVARLLVARPVRRRGVGRRLLALAAKEARDRGLAPILDVVSLHRDAVALYERAGWIRLGATQVTLTNAETIEEYVYAAPEWPGQNAAATSRWRKSPHRATASSAATRPR